ncbi:MAG: hypothetical protein ACI8YQ_003964 [Polaribacter sp.]
MIEIQNDFPQIYIDAGLPVWEKATVSRANKIENGEDAKYQVILTSLEDVHTIAT